MEYQTEHTVCKPLSGKQQSNNLKLCSPECQISSLIVCILFGGTGENAHFAFRSYQIPVSTFSLTWLCVHFCGEICRRRNGMMWMFRSRCFSSVSGSHRGGWMHQPCGDLYLKLKNTCCSGRVLAVRGPKTCDKIYML